MLVKVATDLQALMTKFTILALFMPNFSEGTKTYIYISCHSSTFYIANIMGADVLATQGARASATMIFTVLHWIISVPAR